ncbi:MAG: hypothetical protein AAGD06_07805 [Acidobacteriota bacterium]
MPRRPAIALVLALIAFGCDLGPLCAAIEATQADAGCCCPGMKAPCLDGSEGDMPSRDGEPLRDVPQVQPQVAAAAPLACAPPAEPARGFGDGPSDLSPDAPLFLTHCSWLY